MNRGELKLADFRMHARIQPSYYILKVILCVIGAGVFFIASISLYPVILYGLISTLKSSSYVVPIFLILMFILGIKLIRHRLVIILRVAKKLLYRPQRAFKDPRPPVLLLRPFYVDPIMHESTVTLKTSEERLISALRRIGPVVAVGSPDDKSQPLGALRLYFRDDEWRERVESLISISEVVIVQASYSSELAWEIERCFKLLDPSQLYFSFVHTHLNSESSSFLNLGRVSSRDSDYGTFLLMMNRLIQDKRIPPMNLPTEITGGVLMSFDATWTPVLN